MTRFSFRALLGLVGLGLLFSLAGCSTSRRPLVYVEPSYSYADSEGQVALEPMSPRQPLEDGLLLVRGED